MYVFVVQLLYNKGEPCTFFTPLVLGKDILMPDEIKNAYTGYTEARKRANKEYMKNFVEVKVRMTPDKRSSVQEHAQIHNESTTAFINRAIDETIARDKK